MPRGRGRAARGGGGGAKPRCARSLSSILNSASADVEPTAGPSGEQSRPSLVEQLKAVKVAKANDAKNLAKLSPAQRKQLAELRQRKQVGNFRMPDASEPKTRKGKGKGKGKGKEDTRVWLPCPLLPGVPSVPPTYVPRLWELKRLHDITEEVQGDVKEGSPPNTLTIPQVMLARKQASPSKPTAESVMDAKPPTDEVAPDQKKGKHKTGKGAQARRNEAFRLKKNKETDAMIQAGIFARLKIKDPTSVSSIPIASEVHPVIVPVTFNALPDYVDRVWDTMEATGTRPFGNLNTQENKNIFKKGMQILAEVKLCFAQRAHQDKPDGELPSRKLYTTEELNDYNNMAEQLPYPLAIYLECIGNTADRKQIITPVLAEIDGEYANASGAITYAPRNLLPLLRILRDGVCFNQEVHILAQVLDTLPGIEWEEFEGPAVPPAVAPRMVRLTRASFNFWTEPDGSNFKIKWTDRKYRIFVKIIKSMASRRGFNVSTDLSPGTGSLAQIVQTLDWTVSSSINWLAMTEIPEYDQKLGAAFAFSNYKGNHVQESRFTGTYSTSYIRGEITPRRVMNAILATQE